MKKIIALLCCLLAATTVIFVLMSPSINKSKNQAKITSFQECVSAGYRVLESYPRQCSLPSGQFFVEQMVPEKQ